MRSRAAIVAFAIFPLTMTVSLATSVAAGALAPSSPGRDLSTTTLQQQASAIAQQLAADQQQAAAADANYNQANVVYQNEEARLVSIRADIAIENRRLVTARAKMRRAVVTAYVYGVGAQAEVGAVISGHNLSNANTLATYASVATNQLHSALSEVTRARNALVASETSQERATVAAATAAGRAANARSQNNQVAQSTSVELHKITGQIAAEIAAQAAAAAAAAAQAAAAAKTAAARNSAQAAAQTQSNLAATVAAQDPSNAQAGAAAAAAASSSTTASNVGAPTVILGPSTAAGNLAVTTAESFIGVPYVFGGASSSVGFDCSGLTMVAWQAAGVPLVHNAYFQYTATTTIPIVNNTITLEPGDLLYYYFLNDGNQPVTHVVMYAGSGPYGVATVIAAPQTGENVMYQQLYWGGFVGAGRP